jgi:hypothetical protein
LWPYQPSVATRSYSPGWPRITLDAGQSDQPRLAHRSAHTNRPNRTDRPGRASRSEVALDAQAVFTGRADVSLRSCWPRFTLRPNNRFAGLTLQPRITLHTQAVGATLANWPRIALRPNNRFARLSLRPHWPLLTLRPHNRFATFTFLTHRPRRSRQTDRSLLTLRPYNGFARIALLASLANRTGSTITNQCEPRIDSQRKFSNLMFDLSIEHRSNLK